MKFLIADTFTDTGPTRISGFACKGKTIVVLHRAVFLARKHLDSRVVLTTFADTLANALRTKLRRLISNEPCLAERLEVHSMNAIGERLYELNFGRPKIASSDKVRQLLIESANRVDGHKFTAHLLMDKQTFTVGRNILLSSDCYRHGLIYP